MNNDEQSNSEFQSTILNRLSNIETKIQQLEQSRQLNVENQSHDTSYAMYQTQNIQLSNKGSTFILNRCKAVPTQTLDATPLVDQQNLRNKSNANPSSSTHEIKTFEPHSQTNTEN